MYDRFQKYIFIDYYNKIYIVTNACNIKSIYNFVSYIGHTLLLIYLFIELTN